MKLDRSVLPPNILCRGDIMSVERLNPDWVTREIRRFQSDNQNLPDPFRYISHVGIVVQAGPSQFSRGWDVIEMWPPAGRVQSLLDSKEYGDCVLRFYRYNFTDQEDRLNVVIDAIKKGLRVDYAWGGVINFITHFIKFKSTDALYCSQLVAEAYKDNGAPLLGEKTLVTPGELCMSPKLFLVDEVEM